MKICVCGLGYVGSVSAAMLAELGHHVVGFDINEDKVRSINARKSAVIEPGLEELLARQVEAGRLSATTSCREAIAASELTLVCVGTPSRADGRPDMTFILRVGGDIGRTLRATGGRGHLVALRSTAYPGTTEDVLGGAIEEASGYGAGRDFHLSYNPEFLREGCALDDFRHPPKIVVGARDDEVSRRVALIYGSMPVPTVLTSIPVAEMVKYVDNAFHALKIAFANEIGGLCRAQHIDGRSVMDIFLQDTKLNISPAYLRPGFAFGGSCLPKDLRALVARCRELHLDLPVLRSILRSNVEVIERAVRMIETLGARRISILGLSFKSGTDDLRESPVVEVAERLLGKGYRLRIHDYDVNQARLVGANKSYIEQHLAHLGELLCDDLEEVLRESEVVVIGRLDARYEGIAELMADGRKVVDLARMFALDPEAEPAYHALV